MVAHVFTVDLEEWFHLAPSFAPKRELWDDLEPRVEPLTYSVLELLGKHRASATFFVLGWIAEKYPELIRDISREGHEIASHGFYHKPLSDFTPDEFSGDLKRTSAAIEAAGVTEAVIGFRAPHYSLTPDTAWALDVLADEGYSYDASIFPMIRHDGGWQNTEEGLYHPLRGRDFWEVPVRGARLGPYKVVFSAGGYLRIAPLTVVRSIMRRFDKEGKRAVFVIHPKDIDPQTPYINKGFYTTVRQKLSIGSTKRKLEAVLLEYRFTSIREIIRGPESGE